MKITEPNKRQVERKAIKAAEKKEQHSEASENKKTRNRIFLNCNFIQNRKSCMGEKKATAKGNFSIKNRRWRNEKEK
jgi:hypothetical protein